MPSRWDRRALTGIALALALCAACVEPADTGVAMRNVDVDIVFGAKPEPPPAIPPNAAPPPLSPAGVDLLGQDEEVDLAELEFDEKGFLSRIPPVRTSPASACPSATLADFAPEEAPLNARGLPAVGLYRWKKEGTQELANPPGFKVPIGGFERRLVRNVQQINPGSFRFDTVQAELGSNQIVVSTFKVRTDAASQRVSTTDVRTGEPDRGMTLEKLTRFDPKTGDEIASFTPTPPVLLLPLPVVPGERFQSVGVDPASLETLQVEATVTKRQTVDACGKIVDGWAVDMTRTFASGQTSQTHSYQLIVATQLGALPISERIEATNPTTGTVKVQFTVGQTTPDPLPQDAGTP